MSENAKILLDIAEENPIKDFDRYVSAACAIIRNTEPRFSIGIYGEWGTGKTTMMKGIQKEIENSKIHTVWFDAWRYENEEDHAAIPLLKKIAYSIDESDTEFKTIRERVTKATTIISKNIIQGFFSKNVAELDLEKMYNEFKNKFSTMSHFEKDTLYFEGLDAISEEMAKDKQKKIIIFIDDLDRCSPQKTVQVLESTKAFLDIKGFVFVIGLSLETTAKRIEEVYKMHDIDGHDYIKKIIQVDFPIQTWNRDDTIELIENMTSKLKPFYQQIIGDENINKKLVIVLNKNPRDIKRFINSFIMRNEVYFENQEQEARTFVWIFLFEWRWPKIHEIFTDENNSKFREEIQNTVNMDIGDREKIFKNFPNLKDNDPRRNDFIYADTIEELVPDTNFWEFMNPD